MCRSGENLPGLFLPFHNVDSGDQTWVIRLGSKCLWIDDALLIKAIVLCYKLLKLISLVWLKLWALQECSGPGSLYSQSTFSAQLTAHKVMDVGLCLGFPLGAFRARTLFSLQKNLCIFLQNRWVSCLGCFLIRVLEKKWKCSQSLNHSKINTIISNKWHITIASWYAKLQEVC